MFSYLRDFPLFLSTPIFIRHCFFLFSLPRFCPVSNQFPKVSLWLLSVLGASAGWCSEDAEPGLLQPFRLHHRLSSFWWTRQATPQPRNLHRYWWSIDNSKVLLFSGSLDTLSFFSLVPQGCGTIQVLEFVVVFTSSYYCLGATFLFIFDTDVLYFFVLFYFLVALILWLDLRTLKKTILPLLCCQYWLT